MGRGDHRQHGYTVTYDSAKHISVLTQMYGSVWPSVLPWCILNVLFTALLSFLKHKQIVDLGISDKGHAFMGVFVSFLIVSRVTISLGRYNEGRNNLDVMYRATRELTANACLLTKDRVTKEARKWRNTVAYRTCLLLRVIMAVIDYEDERTRTAIWDLPELCEAEKEDIKAHLYLKVGTGCNSTEKWAHANRCEREETMRVPQRMAWKLRCAILDQRTMLDEKLITIEEFRILSSVSSIMTGYMSLRKFFTTPFPFPLVQMARTFLFLYLATLPFCMLEDMSTLIPRLVVVFVMTYGFLGLETVSISLDNPFGASVNDFDNLGMAYTVFEDIYLFILDVDGKEWVQILRRKMQGQRLGRATWIATERKMSDIERTKLSAIEETELKLSATEETELLSDVGEEDMSIV